MRYSTAVLGAAAFLASEVVAFPAAAIEYAARAQHDPEARSTIEGAIAKYQSTKRAVPFNATAQYVSTSGEYAFVAPGPSDSRGPCPGLNAMANHGYIPHNGVATISQFVQGTEAVFGMANDLGGFLGLYGALIDGNLVSWSIGGDNAAQAIGDGISNSHNKYESDVSPTRPDLYQYGNTYKVIISQFQEMYDLPLGPNGYDLTALTPFRAARFQQSIDNNPYFFNAPFSGVIVQPAAYTFIYRFMSNKSEEYPEGYLNGDVLKSFFSITGESGNFTWTEGWERIPENWYKRNQLDEYSIPFFLVDLLNAALEFPQFLNIGGNTGTVNTFAGVDIQNLTGGVYNAADLLKGDNAVCFVFQTLQNAVSDLLLDVVEGLVGALDQLDPYISDFLQGITCPQLNVYEPQHAFAPFPGAKNAV